MFDAAKANELFESAVKERVRKASLPKKVKWNLLDALQLKMVERKIKQCCKKERRMLSLGGYPIRDRVLARLRGMGYKVYVGKIEGKVIEVEIEW